VEEGMVEKGKIIIKDFYLSEDMHLPIKKKNPLRF